MGDGTAATRHANGFTVAELLVACTVMLITVTASISGIMFAAQATSLSERRTEALNLANQQIEMARNLSFDEIATVEPSNGLPAGKVPGVQTVGRYTVVIDIAYGTYGASAAARYKTIAATVSWSEPTSGSVTVSSMIAGASGTQAYNFGNIALTVQDESSPARGVPGVTVWLTDVGNRSYNAATSSTGTVQFTYIPSGSVTVSATKPGFVIDALASPSCVANTTTAYGPITAHALRTGLVQCLSPAGAPVSGVTVGLSAGPNTVSPAQTDASGYATFPSALIKGTYTVGITHNLYQLTTSKMLTVGSADAQTSVTLSVKPSSVTATCSLKGTVYVWNSGGTLNTSLSTSSSKPYTAVLSLTNPDIQPKVYYFTMTNTFANTTSATVTPGMAYAVTVK
jgi:Tfp pilus assembly protein PilV